MMNCMFQELVVFGILLAQLVNIATAKVDYGWRLSLGLAAVPALVLVVGCWCLPDTPNGLIERGKDEEGARVLRAIRGVDDVSAELADIHAAARLARATNGWKALASRRYRPQLALNILIPVFQMLTGEC
jgi:hypothetical protein